MSQLKKFLVALTPMGAAAYVAGGGTFSSVEELVHWAEHPTHRAVAPSESTKGDPLWRTKKALLLMMAIGAAAYFGFSGTFANFQAETANNGSSISSGTLTLNNLVGTNTANTCFSYSAASVDNLNNGCTAAFATTNTAPGVFASTQVAQITLTNSGSIDASKLYLYGSQVSGKLGAALTASATSVTLSAPGLEGSITAGDSLQLAYAGHTLPLTAGAGGAAGKATTIPVTGVPATLTFPFPAGSTLTDLSGNTSPSNTDCYDTRTTVPGIVGATIGTDLNFNTAGGNPFCSSVLMWVQEVSPAGTYCWFGKGSVWSTPGFAEDANGRCVSPINVTTSGLPVNATTTSIPLASGVTLNGNVRATDTILVKDGTHSQTFQAATAATFGATSITVASANVATAFANGAIVTDTAAQNSLDSNASTDTISQFQTNHRLIAGKLDLLPVSGNGTLDSTGAPALSHGASRTFYVGIYLPLVGATNQNALQGLASTFGLSWHIDQ